MSYDGSATWAAFEHQLERDGFVLAFSCATFDKQPPELGYDGKENGWALRRKLKAYCAAKGIARFRVVRNTSYHRDLHGTVYQLWTHRDERTGT